MLLVWNPDGLYAPLVLNTVYTYTFRYDRSPLASSCNRGGGVLIAVLKDCCANFFNIPYTNVEQLFIFFSFNSIKCIICSVYLPPSSSLNLYNSHLNTIDFTVHKYPDLILILTGDYNLPFISWSNDAYVLCYSSQSIFDSVFILERLALNDFYQHNFILNSHYSLLYLIFSNHKSLSVSSSRDSAAPPDNYYLPLSLSINFPTSSPLI